MARKAEADGGETRDELTENGILSDHPSVTLVDYRDLHGEPVAETDDRVLFADSEGYEYNEWADALEISRTELSERMHELAGEMSDRRWGTDYPLVFDVRTFKTEKLASRCPNGCGLLERDADDVLVCSECGYKRPAEIPEIKEREYELRDAGLSEREAEVMARTLEGWTNGEVADALGIAVGTVDSNRSRAREKRDAAERLLEAWGEGS
jgi:DNA-binding CsgD family transcriptional regulator